MAFAVIFAANSLALLLFGGTLVFGRNRGLFSIICNLLFLNGILPFCNNNVMPGGWYIGTTAILYAITPLILFVIRKLRNRKAFFIISSAIGMVIWAALYFAFKSVFSNAGFDYFFFLVHYPEYLLGIMLYYDLSESILKSSQIKLCLPLGLIVFAIAYILFYTSIPLNAILSAWMTAFATYLVLYNMISNESEKLSWFENILSKFGRNSYCIFLLHAFYAWTFMLLVSKVLEKFGLDVHTYFWLFVLIPVVLALSYFTGFIFNIIVKKVTELIFKK